MIVKLIPNDTHDPPNKLADAELLFDDTDGAMAGIKLIGFAIWQLRPRHARTVTLPARTFTIHNERRAYALVRPIATHAGIARLRTLILTAYEEFEARRALAQ